MNTIRRSDAIDALMKTFWFLNPDSITDVIMGVEDAQPQQWIPCSERLPEKDGFYLVQGYGGDVLPKIKYFHSDDYGHYWNGFVFNALAWMPLPEPYRREQSDEAD